MKRQPQTDNLARRRAQRARRDDRDRRGAALVEAAICLPVLLILILGMLDLGIRNFRHNTLSHAARQLARKTVVHGELADELGPWGTGTWTGTAADTGPIPDAVRPYLSGLNPADVTITVEWPDGGHDVRAHDHVRVRLSAPYQPMMTFIFGSPTYDLTAESVMEVAH